MNSVRRSLFLPLLLLALAFGATSAAVAGASPAWKFNGVELMAKSETIMGTASESRLSFAGLTTTCETTEYQATISNSAGTGMGKVNEMPFENCSTNSKYCSVETNVAEGFPWAAKLVTLSESNYIVITGVRVTLVYSGPECVAAGISVVVTGSAGGLYANTSETITFSSSTFSATKTALKALGSGVEWEGVFSAEATGPHLGEALTVS